MVMMKLDVRLLRLIKNTKGQFIAISSLIIVGLIIYVAMNMAAINLDTTLQHYYDITNFADIYVEVVRIPEKAVQKLTSINDVRQAQGRVVADVPLKVEDEDEKVIVRVTSISEKNNPINALYPSQGKSTELKSKETFVIKQFADARNIKLGQTIQPQIGGKRYNLKVSGIASSPEHIYLMKNEQSLLPEPEKFGVIYVSESFAQQSMGFHGSYNEVLITVDSEKNIEKVKELLKKELKKYGVKRIYAKEEQLSNRMVHEEIKQLRNTSTAVPLVFLGIAAVIISVMLGRMVKNDRMAIGIFKALGYGNLHIMLHYSKYSLMVGVIGAILGITFGMLLSGIMTKMYIQFFNIPMLRINFYYQYLLLAVLIAAAFCVASGLWGAREVIRIMPAESMKPEAPGTGGEIFLEKIRTLWKHLPFDCRMVLRNIFRNKKRFIFIILGISLTYSMVLLTLHLNTAVTDIFYIHYREFQRMDYNINFDKPVNENIINDIKHIVKVEKIEPKLEYPFNIVYGWKNKVVNIIGLKENTEFYKFINKEGRKIILPREGIVLSENLARFLGVSTGDTIKIETFIPNRDDVYIEVKDVIQQGLGINAYMNIEEMRNLFLDREMITSVYLNSNDRVKEKLDDLKNISSVESIHDMMETFRKFLDLTIYSIGIMLLFAGILGFAIVYNSTVINISERRLEFSTLRVLGFAKKEIHNILLKENVIMTVIGIIMGMPLGRFMIEQLGKVYSTELYTFDVPTSLRTYLMAIVLTMVFIAFAQLATVNRINKLNFIDALKNRIS